MPEIVFKGKEYVYNHHLTVPYRLLLLPQRISVQCDLVFEGDWRGTLNARQFA